MSVDLYLTSNAPEEEEMLCLSKPLEFIKYSKYYKQLEALLDFPIAPLFEPPEYVDLQQPYEQYQVFLCHKEQGSLDNYWENLAKRMSLPPNLEPFKSTLMQWLEALETKEDIYQQTNTLLYTLLPPLYAPEEPEEEEDEEEIIQKPRDFTTQDFCDSCPDDGVYCLKEGDCFLFPSYDIKNYGYSVADLVKELKAWLKFVLEQEQEGANKFFYY